MKFLDKNKKKKKMKERKAQKWQLKHFYAKQEKLDGNFIIKLTSLSNLILQKKLNWNSQKSLGIKLKGMAINDVIPNEAFSIRTCLKVKGSSTNEIKNNSMWFDPLVLHPDLEAKL